MSERQKGKMSRVKWHGFWQLQRIDFSVSREDDNSHVGKKETWGHSCQLGGSKWSF